MGEFAGGADHYAAAFLVLPVDGGDLVENAQDVDCSLACSCAGLAEHILALHDDGDGLVLDLAGVLEAHIPDGLLEFVLEVEVVPALEAGGEALHGLQLADVDFLLVGDVLVVGYLHNE